MSPDFFRNLHGLTIAQLLDREKAADDLLQQAEAEQQAADRAIVEGAADLVASADGKALEKAEHRARVAAVRATAARTVAADVAAALAEARDRLDSAADRARRVDEAPTRRKQLQQQLEAALQRLAVAQFSLDTGAGLWLTVELPPKPGGVSQPSQRRLTMRGENARAERDGYQAEVDRIRSELAALDELQAA